MKLLGLGKLGGIGHLIGLEFEDALADACFGQLSWDPEGLSGGQLLIGCQIAG